jgi:hypothetical protein
LPDYDLIVMKRSLLSLLVATMLGIGAAPLEWLHQKQADHFWTGRAARIAALNGRENSPLRPVQPLPARPAHDPSKCIFCIAMQTGSVAPPIVVIVPRPQIYLGDVLSAPGCQYIQAVVSSPQCRGPPSA